MFEQNKEIKMKKKAKQIITWSIVLIIIILVVDIACNIDGFVEGFKAGSNLAK